MSEESTCVRQNTGTVDRMIRAVVGVGLIILAGSAKWSSWAIALVAALGGSFVVEAITGF